MYLRELGYSFLMENTQYVGLLVFSSSGIPLFEFLSKEQFSDATLLTGLLTALQALTIEVTEKKLEELELQEFQIFLQSSQNFPITYAIISTGRIIKKHANEVMGNLKHEFENNNGQIIQQCLDFGSIPDFAEFKETCKEIFEKANNYVHELLTLKSEFFGNEKGNENDKKEKLKEEFF